MATAARPMLRREDVKDAANLCDHCWAKCCRYFALAIDTPEERSDFDYIRWYLLHEHATVFVEDGSWYLLVHTECKHLEPDHRCGIYHTRPQICRDYSTDDCEFDDHWCYEQYFETPEQITEYVDAVYPAKRTASIRSPEPPLLPIA
jgi:Fe-S-cluster containining protein